MLEYTIPVGENFEITPGQILLAVLVIVGTRFILSKVRNLAKGNINSTNYLLPKTLSYAKVAILCLCIIFLVQIFKIDDLIDGLQLDQSPKSDLFRVSNLLWLFLVFLIARLADNFFTEYLKTKATSQSNSNVSGVQYFVWLLLGGLILSQTSYDYNINPTTTDGAGIIRISNVMWAAATLIGAHILSSIVIHVFLERYYKIKKIDVGAQYAINTLLRYLIYMIAAIIAIQRLGFDAAAIWGALAGAAIVVGLGLQQVVNDFASGVLLLFERSILVGHVIKVDGIIGKVKRIGIRASILETRDDTNLIIPNSHLVSNNVINWNFGRSRVKFSIPVGVAYGSDTKLVESLLLKSIAENNFVLQKPAPFVWFKSFDDSALTFELHYWSNHLMQEDNVKSDIRYQIDQLFRENGIEIPFPQRVIHSKKG